MLFPLTTVVVAALLVAAWRTYGRRGALTVGLSVWLFALLIGLVPVVEFQVAYSLSADVFAAGCIGALALAYMAVRKSPTGPPAQTATPKTERQAVILALGVGLLGCFMVLADARLAGMPLSLTGLTSNLADVRSTTNDPVEQAARGGRPLFQFGIWFMSFAYVGIAAAIVRPTDSTVKRLFWAALVGIAAVSLLVFAGRTILINGVLLALVALLLSPRRVTLRHPKAIVAVAALSVAGWYFSVEYFTAREGGQINVPKYLHELERARLPDSLKAPVNESPALGSAIVNYGYFASPAPSLSWYMQQPDIPGPYWGSASFPLKPMLLGRFVPQTDWSTIREQTFSVLESRGYAGNIWPTWLRDLRLDWGYYGAMLFCALFGAFMAWVRNVYERRGKVHFQVLEALAALTFAFGAFQNLLWVNVYSTTFIAALVMWAAIAFVTKPRRNRAVRRSFARERYAPES